MKNGKVLVKIALCFLILTALACFASCSDSDSYKPEIRFAVTSDIHIRDNENEDYESRKLFETFMQSAYAYSEAQEDYSGLDGIFVVGDLTQGGTDNEFEDFFAIANSYVKEGTTFQTVIGNHEFYATKYDDGTNDDIRYSDTSVKNTYDRYMQYGGYDSVDTHLVIGGYHFIFLSMDRYDKDDSNFFSDDKIEWLDNELTKAAYDDPTGKKPIFVFQHEPPLDTMYGSGRTGSDADLKKILSYYPQVVDFSGHTHRTPTDPRAIWQGEFTALNTGSLAYLGLVIAGHPSKDQSGVSAINGTGAWEDAGSEENIRNAFTYYMVEVDANDTVRVSVCDIRTNERIGEPMIFNVGNPDEFEYTSDRAATELRPIWKDTDEIKLEENLLGQVMISNPQAYSASQVQNYRVELYCGGVLKKTVYTLSCNYYGDLMPERVYTVIPNIEPSTDYTVKVFPVSSWGRAGAPLTLEFKSVAATAENEAPTPDILNTVFNSDGSATNAVTGEALGKYGAPTVKENNAIGKSTATFDGDDAYTFENMDYWYPLMRGAYTIELYVFVPKKPTGTYSNLISNQESGGFGLLYRTDGKLQFAVGIGETAQERPQVQLPEGEWVHIVATYTGVEMAIYINGIKASTAVKIGKLQIIPYEYSKYLAIGADSAKDAPEHFASCEIAAANIYSYALTAEQVAQIYSSLSAK
ncbi:MAG: metallophosphoesterase [Clostridia bacterium]|nr:metallophosphoesterase [Clostridia bacterium]